MATPPAPEVAAWVAAQPDEQLFTTSVCHAEVLSGLAIMPEGRRRLELQAAAGVIFTKALEGRILAFDTAAAAAYANVLAMRKRSGRSTAPLDLMIASVAVVHDATVVTRDISGFEGCGLALVNPWDAS